MSERGSLGRENSCSGKIAETGGLHMKKIGILTSGGDAPGMNAVIRTVVRAGIAYGMDVMGIQQGYRGLIDDDMKFMDATDVEDIMQRGGTILRTARCEEFPTEIGRAHV